MDFRDQRLEEPGLYYEILRLNPHCGEVYRAAQEALGELVELAPGPDS